MKKPLPRYISSNAPRNLLIKGLILTVLASSLLLQPQKAEALLFFGKNDSNKLAPLEPQLSPEEKKLQRMEKNLSVPITKSKAKKVSDAPEEVYVDITADQVEYDQEKNFYEAIGNAQTYLPDKKATLLAEKITFDGKSKLIEATGNVQVNQAGQIITGSYASFKVDSREYELQNPRVFLKGIKLKARVSHAVLQDPDAKKKKDTESIYFDDGVVAFSQPRSVYVRGSVPGTRYSQERDRERRNRKVNWSDLPGEPIFRYSAKQIIYDDKKEINNLKIKGARIHITDRISIPAPVHITATTGERSDTQYLGPIFGTRTRLGGFNIGPRFYHPIDQGTFALAPVFQLGNNFDVGIGAIASFNTPGDTTALMGGYGTLDNRVIANLHQDLPLGFELNYLKNQFVRGAGIGVSQVGQLAELGHRGKLNLPFLDQRQGIRFYTSAAFAEDNDELFSERRLEDFLEERNGDGEVRRFDKNFNDFRTAQFLQLYTKPFYRLGNEYYNASLRGFGQNSLRFYGSGDVYNIGRFGPALEFQIRGLRAELSYLTAIVSGESPFLFDQFVDGNQAVLLDGDYQINDWITLGAFFNYNLSDDRFSRLQLRTEFGPSDFKFRVSYDTIRNQIGFGLNMIFGDPVEYDKLRVDI